MSITFAAQLAKMITAGLGGAMVAPETNVSVGHWFTEKTATGNPVSFSDGAGGKPVKSLEIGFSPVQDLNGYDEPWAGGAGKNKLEIKSGTYELSGIKAVIDATDGTIILNGSASNNVVILGNLATGYISAGSGQNDGVKHIPNGTYILYVNDESIGVRVQVSGTNASSGISDVHSIVDTQTSATFTIDNTYAYNYARLYVPAGTYTNVTIRPMIYLASETDTSFAPYANICPISGWSQLELHHADDTEEIQLGATYYAGTVDVVSGDGSATWGYIASYNGESLPGEWLSDRDAYAEGTTPTTGAEVAYALASPTTFSVTPLDIVTQEGGNIFITDANGNMTITYTAVGYVEGY